MLRLRAHVCPGLPAQLVRGERAHRSLRARGAWRRSACQASAGGCAPLAAQLLRAARAPFTLRARASRARSHTRRSWRCFPG
jgi:hypothetical protein